MNAISWRATRTPAGEYAGPADLPASLEWLPSAMPATAASVLLAAGRPAADLDDDDWWWQAELPAASFLLSPGIATLSEFWVGSARLHTASGMFQSVELPLVDAAGSTLTIKVPSLMAALARKRPRPRWKARLVDEQRLRWFRTSLTGRMPGYLDGSPVVGPWRGVTLVSADGSTVLSPGVSTVLLADGSGEVTVSARLCGVTGATATVVVGSLRATADVAVDDAGIATVSAVVTVPDPPLWWPHSHGPAPLLPVSIEINGSALSLGQTGFRSVSADETAGGFALNINGCRVFARGACWSPIAEDGTHLNEPAIEETLRLMVAAGLTLVRILGTTAWAAPEFFAVCDRLGIMVWQDVPMAAMDQPVDPEFEQQLGAEIRSALAAVSQHPSLVVVCGGAEIEQQAAMLGLAVDTPAAPLSTGLISDLVTAAAANLGYVANSPTGGIPAFRVDVGVAQYFGVGAYRRPLEDARRADVKFAAECFAFAVPPHDATVEVPGELQAVPRDRDADWDFAEVSNHYAREFFGASVCDSATPTFLRDLHSAAAAECLSALLCEWRRPASSCAGAVAISLRDVVPGPGWGLLDSSGRPKSTWYAARRAASPLALLHTDEGLNGLALHVVNDLPASFNGSLRLDLCAGERVVESGSLAIEVGPHNAVTWGDVDVLGAFRDVTRAYRFGSASFDLVVGLLLDDKGNEMGRTVYLPLGRTLVRTCDLGLAVELVEREGTFSAVVRTVSHARSVVVSTNDGIVEDAWFDLLPGETRELAITPGAAPTAATVRALNGQPTPLV